MYTAVLFFHIIGALGFFSALFLEWAGLIALRKAQQAEAVSATIRMLGPLHWLYPLSGATILLSGSYMTVVSWGFEAWIVISVAIIVLLAITGRTVTGWRLEAIGKQAEEERGAASVSLRQRKEDRMLYDTHVVRIALALGVMVLMVYKPVPAVSWLTTGIALTAGVIWSLFVRKPQSAPVGG